MITETLKKFAALAAAIIICQASGAIGSMFTIKAIPTWYAALEKPFFNPPNWVFGPVWITLYTMMGVSLFLVWNSRGGIAGFKSALLIFAVQLLLNAVWTPVFFGARMMLPAFVIIVMLWAAIIATIIKFTSINKAAAALLIPYLLWVSFASVLNFSLWYLNRG